MPQSTMADIRTLEDEGVVLAWIDDFAIIVTLDPNAHTESLATVMCYGVLNTNTGVIEAYVSSFAKAKYLAGQFQKDLSEGYDRMVPAPSFPDLSIHIPPKKSN